MNFRLTRFEAPTMGEALQQIRATLGSDAMIVSTRTFRRGGMLGVGGQEIVEVYAADTRSRIENIKREKSSRARSSQGAAVPAAEEPLDSSLAAPAAASRAEALPERGMEAEAEALPGLFGAGGSVRQEARGMPARGGESPRHTHAFLRECFEVLITHEVEPRMAEMIVQQIALLRLPSGYPDPSRVRAMLRAQLTKLFLPNPPLDDRRRPRVVALVGPTGVGKTTTIAKLAARAKISDRRRVGLITIDTFRLAAVDQLERYAQIIGLPLLVATGPEELESALAEYAAKEMDLVFVDSAGRSHRDELKMAELREFLSVLPQVEVHLVVSTTTHGKTIQSIAGRFAGIGFQKVILTKVDETISFGSLVDTLTAIGRPVSFVTDGQNVPDDIVAGDPDRLADLVLKTHAM